MLKVQPTMSTEVKSNNVRQPSTHPHQCLLLCRPACQDIVERLIDDPPITLYQVKSILSTSQIARRRENTTIIKNNEMTMVISVWGGSRFTISIDTPSCKYTQYQIGNIIFTSMKRLNHLVRKLYSSTTGILIGGSEIDTDIKYKLGRDLCKEIVHWVRHEGLTIIHSLNFHISLKINMDNHTYIVHNYYDKIRGIIICHRDSGRSDDDLTASIIKILNSGTMDPESMIKLLPKTVVRYQIEIISRTSKFRTMFNNTTSEITVKRFRTQWDMPDIWIEDEHDLLPSGSGHPTVIPYFLTPANQTQSYELVQFMDEIKGEWVDLSSPIDLYGGKHRHLSQTVGNYLIERTRSDCREIDDVFFTMRVSVVDDQLPFFETNCRRWMDKDVQRVVLFHATYVDDEIELFINHLSSEEWVAITGPSRSSADAHNHHRGETGQPPATKVYVEQFDRDLLEQHHLLLPQEEIISDENNRVYKFSYNVGPGLFCYNSSDQIKTGAGFIQIGNNIGTDVNSIKVETTDSAMESTLISETIQYKNGIEHGRTEKSGAITTVIEATDEWMDEKMIGYKAAVTFDDIPCVVKLILLKESKIIEGIYKSRTNQAIVESIFPVTSNTVYDSNTHVTRKRYNIKSVEYAHCNGCGRSNGRYLLTPCHHKMCQPCLNSSLNKRECGYCYLKIDQFQQVITEYHPLTTGNGEQLTYTEAYPIVYKLGNVKSYRQGQVVTVPDFDSDVDKVCGKGIHYHKTEQQTFDWFNYITKLKDDVIGKEIPDHHIETRILPSRLKNPTRPTLKRRYCCNVSPEKATGE